MLSLKSFHLFFIALSIILTSALGVWGLFNHYVLLGLISLGMSILLVLYEAYFASKAQRIHLE
jgi:hypothetical protein